MILSGKMIHKVIEEKTWNCNKEHDALKIGPNSVDVTLSRHFLIPKNDITEPIDLENVNGEDLFNEIETSELILKPYSLVLGSVNESFDCSLPLSIDSSIPFTEKMPKNNKQAYRFVQHYEGRSTLGRMGLQSHVTAGFGDYGFKGSFTLELINNGPWTLILREGMRIGQVYFEVVIGDVDKYDGYDQKDCKPQYPRLGKNRF
jgi:deoxycytidine triphosphate deaminase